MFYTWQGWDDECEPKEPGKKWLTICDPDGEEVATIVCRDFDKVKAEHPEWIRAKERNARLIADALNVYTGRTH